MTQPSVQPGNSKLGQEIHAWSITAGKEASCPGETSLCKSVCYARRGLFTMPSVEASHAANKAFSLTPEFGPWMRKQLFLRDIKTLRVHASGDFYSNEYIDKWLAIAKSSKTQFFAYTRSWYTPPGEEVEVDVNKLIELALLPNFRVWLSADAETGEPPPLPMTSVAYMAMSDKDKPAFYADLVFRVQRNTVLKKESGILVCPAENGIKLKRKMTCSQCRFCSRLDHKPAVIQLYTLGTKSNVSSMPKARPRDPNDDQSRRSSAHTGRNRAGGNRSVLFKRKRARSEVGHDCP